VREGDWKALKIGSNTYLFNVVDDPLERADQKTASPEIYQRLTRQWDVWNRTMLPETPRSFTYNNTVAEWADHINTPTVDVKVVDDAAKTGVAENAQ